MSKKIVAMLMAVAMAFSLLPVTAFAAGGPSATTTKDVVDGHYEGENGTIWTQGQPTRTDSLKNTVTIVNKTAEKVEDNQYNVTLTVQMKHKETDVPPGAAATVLVIDKSGSMNYCTDPTHTHTKDRYGNECGTWPGRTSRLSVAKTAAINFLKSYSGFSNSNFNENGSLKNNVSGKNLRRYVSLVTFNDSASLQTWGKWNNQESWIDVSTKDGYDKLFKAINEIKAKEGTNLDAALRLAKTQMQSGSITQIDPSKRNVIALTDGVPTYYVGEGQYTDITWNVEQHGSYGCPTTNQATATSATALKAKVNAVYTVCFGAKNQKCWNKNSICGFDKHEKDGPTVGKFLEDSIATKPADGSNKKYAYNADNADKLYEAFAAITQTITDGLNEGVVTDGLPNGVSCTDGTFGEDGTLTWNLKSNEATVTKDGEYNVYTYTKTYKVNVDPATVKTVEVGEVNYAPLNTPTTLTVQHNGSPVKIHFPIPAGKVTYSLTGFNKELVTEADNFSNPPEGVTIPANTTDPVVVSGEGVTLLYKITVKGDKGAKFTVTDDGATLVSPKDDTITTGDNSTFSGTVGNTGTTVFYVSKQFTQDNIEESGDKKTVSNTAIIAPGDNTNGLTDNEKTVDTKVTEPAPQNYKVTYQWADDNRPSDATLPNAGNPFILSVGQKHTVEDVPESSVTTNAAGKTGTWSCAWDRSGTIEGTANQEIVITGTWTFTEDPPKTGNLIVKKVVSGGGVTLNDLPNITITVAGTGTNSTYSRELTLATQDTAEPASTTVATWTIPDLTPGTYTVSESNADVKDYTYTTTYNNGAANSDTVNVEKNKNITMTVTNTYTENATVDLSQLIKKTTDAKGRQHVA